MASRCLRGCMDAMGGAPHVECGRGGYRKCIWACAITRAHARLSDSEPWPLMNANEEERRRAALQAGPNRAGALFARWVQSKRAVSACRRASLASSASLELLKHLPARSDVRQQRTKQQAARARACHVTNTDRRWCQADAGRGVASQGDDSSRQGCYYSYASESCRPCRARLHVLFARERALAQRVPDPRARALPSAPRGPPASCSTASRPS